MPSTDMASPDSPDAKWIVEAPKVDNPLRIARLAGRSRYGGLDHPASLEIGCRADDDAATITVGFAVPGTLGFDFAAFEGPEGIGQIHPLLRVGDADGIHLRHRVGGWWLDTDTFMFGAYVPLDADLVEMIARWPALAGRPVEMAILSIEKNTDPDRILTVHFILPDDGDALQKIIEPCVGR